MSKRKLNYENASGTESSTTKIPKTEIALNPSTIYPTKNATIEGVITYLSPMKEKYFEGELITDGSKQIRIVGFDREQHTKIDRLCNTAGALQLANCEIKENERNHKCEILVNKHTIIVSSPKKFDISASQGSKNIKIEDIPAMEQYAERVTVDVQVLRVKAFETVPTGKKKQDVVIADNTGSTTITLWENDIDMLEVTKCYRLAKVLTQEYKNRSYLSFPASGSVSEIDAIELGVRDEDPHDGVLFLQNVDVVSVSDLGERYHCLLCKVDQVKPLDKLLGKCSECGTTMKLDKCKYAFTAKLGFLNNVDHSILSLKANEQILKSITDEPITESAILAAEPFSIYYCNSDNNTITGIVKINKTA